MNSILDALLGFMHDCLLYENVFKDIAPMATIILSPYLHIHTYGFKAHVTYVKWKFISGHICFNLGITNIVLAVIFTKPWCLCYNALKYEVVTNFELVLLSTFMHDMVR